MQSKGADGSELSGLKFAVFGLGNKQYEHFNAVGRKVDGFLKALGAASVCDRGEGDDDEVRRGLGRPVHVTIVGEECLRELVTLSCAAHWCRHSAAQDMGIPMRDRTVGLATTPAGHPGGLRHVEGVQVLPGAPVGGDPGFPAQVELTHHGAGDPRL